MKTAQIASSGRSPAPVFPRDRPISVATETQLYCTEKILSHKSKHGMHYLYIVFGPFFIVDCILEWVFRHVNGSESQAERQLTVSDEFVRTLYEQWRQTDLTAVSLLTEHTTNSTKLF